jgi:hypothetical protein
LFMKQPPCRIAMLLKMIRNNIAISCITVNLNAKRQVRRNEGND